MQNNAVLKGDNRILNLQLRKWTGMLYFLLLYPVPQKLALLYLDVF